MAPRRNTTPLFEIVSRNGNVQPTPVERRPEPPPPESDSHLEHDPAPAATRRHHMSDDDAAASEPAPLAPSREPDTTREIPRTMGRISVAGGTVRLPINYAYVGLSGVLVLGLIAWTLGYVFGGRNADEKARQEIETATGGPTLRDPLDDGADPDRVASTMGQPGQTPVQPGGTDRSTNAGVRAEPGTTPAINVPAGLPAVTDRRTAYLAPGGYFEREPRQEGLNYLCLVSRLPEADAAAAIDFLAKHWDRFPFAEMIGSEFSLDRADEAFQQMLATGAIRFAVRP